MKPMVYKKRGDIEILDNGIYNGYQYWIVSYGSHPCAYVELPKDHKYYGKDYVDIPIDCHGGITYSGIHEKFSNGFLIGWDYGHCDDYLYYNPTKFLGSDIQSFLDSGKKWTTEEIFEEVKQVIDQL